MSVTYKRPPLVELVAELRWGPVAPQGQVPIAMPRPKDEELFMNFGMLAAQRNFGRLERVIPPGVPAPLGTVMCRFRPTQTDQQSPLLQIGRGVITANALPPNYQSWETFAPVTRQAVEMMFEAHAKSNMSLPNITQALVRYVDVFDARLTDGRDTPSFMREILGIDVNLPPAINKLATATIEPSINFEVPCEIGILNIRVGPVKRHSDKGVLLDSTLLIQREIGTDIEAAMRALTEGRGVIHNLFRELTKPIHALMEPVT